MGSLPLVSGKGKVSRLSSIGFSECLLQVQAIPGFMDLFKTCFLKFISDCHFYNKKKLHHAVYFHE